MRRKELLDSADTGSVWKKARKLVIAKRERLCSLCPYHGGENARRNKIDRRNWKRRRSTRWKSQRGA
ncbi:MAG: hypothetical protein ACT4NX_06750 [Deltaproteobacteria bacterium]